MARGWPVVLREGDVVLRPLRRRDASAWLALRARNAAWLDPWEATSPERPTGPPPSFGRFVRTLSEQARAGTALPFAMAYRGELVGQLTVSTIVRGSLCSASIGYWIGEHVAGRGITPTAVALAVDHCLGPGEEGLRQRYLHIQGRGRDHRAFAVTGDEVPDGLLSRWRRVQAGPS